MALENKMLEAQRKTCRYYVENKKRYCRMTVGVGYMYCGEHIELEKSDSDSGHLRIPCPYDNRHSCFARVLNKHLKKCNSRPSENPSYFSKDINKGIPTDIPAPSLAEIDTEELNSVLDNIKSVYQGLSEYISEEILEHEVLHEAIGDPQYGMNSRKHLIQNSSLIGHFHKLNLSENLKIIEFGAGKGKLTYWIAKSLPNPQQYKFILIDKSTLRHKSENKIKELFAGNVHRYRVDIGNLRLSQLPPLGNTGKCVGISKHLCGSATDLALRCLIGGKEESEALEIIGILVAVCCHHRCDWASYSGKDFLLESGFHPSQFRVMCGIASWATSGSGRKKHPHEEPNMMLEEEKPLERKKTLTLSTEEKANYGRMCKILLDYGRKTYLERCGFICDLKYYVKPEVSPENVCLFAQLKM